MQHILELTSTWEVREYLKHTPKSLAALYDSTLQRLFHQSESRSRLARKVLIWVALGKRSLTLTELQHALAVTSEEATLNPERISPQEIIKRTCFNLITVDPRSSIVLLSHYSFQNYLEQCRNELFKESIDRNVIEWACLDYLLLEEFKSGPCRSAKDLEERLRKYPFARYAAIYWGDHPQKGDPVTRSRMDSLLESPATLMSTTQIYFAELQILIFEEASLSKFSPLHWAATFGLAREVKYLLRTHPQVLNAQDPLGRSPLHWAVERHHSSVVGILLKHGASTSILDRHHANVLHLAAKDSSNTSLEALLDAAPNVDLLQKDRNELTPLQIAAIEGSLDAVQLILNAMTSFEAFAATTRAALQGAASNGRADVVELLVQVSELDASELCVAARYGFEDVVRILYEHGADLDACDGKGVTALHAAAAAGKLDMILYLLDNGAHIDIKDQAGSTPLLYAVRESNRLAVEVLFRQGADINLQDDNGNTALDVAVETDDTEIAQLLLSYGASISTFKHASNVLSQAVLHDNETIVRSLLDADPLIASASDGSDTALHLAARRGHTEIVSLLLESGLDPLMKGSMRQTPLHVAAAAGKTAIIDLLIKQGADVNAQDANMDTPFELAKRNQHKEAEALLLDAGADTRLEKHLSQPLLTQRLPRVAGDTQLMEKPRTKAHGGGDLCVGIHFEAQFLRKLAVELIVLTQC
jgi:ankyrin repeat protein